MDASSPQLKHYYRIWRQSVVMNFRTNTSSLLEFITYVIAKMLRMAFFFVFVFALFRNTKSIVGYTEGEVLLFFAVMNTLDISFQLLCRGLSTVPAMVRRGEFDVLCTKPISPFFFSCFKMFDFMDLATVPAALIFLGVAIQQLPNAIAFQQILLACICWICSLIMAISLNTIIASLAFWVTEIENGIWIYRDLVYVGRFPPEVFPSSIQSFFTYFIPILLIVATPAKALMGKASASILFLDILITVLLALLASLIWKKALRRYASASA